MNDVCLPEIHEAMKRDEAVWASLEYVGVQMLDGKPFCTMRNCPCGSTLARQCECEPEEVAAHA